MHFKNLNMFELFLQYSRSHASPVFPPSHTAEAVSWICILNHSLTLLRNVCYTCWRVHFKALRIITIRNMLWLQCSPYGRAERRGRPELQKLFDQFSFKETLKIIDSCIWNIHRMGERKDRRDTDCNFNSIKTTKGKCMFFSKTCSVLRMYYSITSYVDYIL